MLVITSSEHRTQLANKEAALQRAQMCIFGAVEDAAPPKEASDEKKRKMRKLEEKKRRAAFPSNPFSRPLTYSDSQ